MRFLANYPMNNRKEIITQVDPKPESTASLGFWVSPGAPQHKQVPLLYT